MGLIKIFQIFRISKLFTILVMWKSMILFTKESQEEIQLILMREFLVKEKKIRKINLHKLVATIKYQKRN